MAHKRKAVRICRRDHKTAPAATDSGNPERIHCLLRPLAPEPQSLRAPHHHRQSANTEVARPPEAACPSTLRSDRCSVSDSSASMHTESQASPPSAPTLPESSRDWLRLHDWRGG